MKTHLNQIKQFVKQILQLYLTSLNAMI